MQALTWVSARRFETNLFDAQRAVDAALLSSVFQLAGGENASEELVERILDRFGSVAQALRANATDWRQIEGMTDRLARSLSLMRATVKSAAYAPINDRALLCDWNDLIAYLKVELPDDLRERFRVLFLNKNGYLLEDELMSVGTVDQTAVYPREVMRRALSLGSTRLILVHNHPSGDLQPSAADIALTREIDATGQPLDVRVYDHVIISRSGYSSFRLLGLI